MYFFMLNPPRENMCLQLNFTTTKVLKLELLFIQKGLLILNVHIVVKHVSFYTHELKV